MDVKVLAVSEAASLDTLLLAVPVRGPQGDLVLPWLPDALGGVVASLRIDARPDAGHTVSAPTGLAQGPRRIALIGAGGDKVPLDAEAVRRFAAHAVRAAERLRLDGVAVVLPEDPACGLATAARAAAEGAVLAAWRFTELKTPKDDDPAPVVHVDVLAPTALVDSVRDEVALGTVLAQAENRARDLQSRPGNVATPTHLGEEAERIARETGLEVEVHGRPWIEKQKMGALLAVTAGSEQEPRFIVLRHRGGAEGERPLVLVGKGLTFDAGGISIKPAEKMEDMKFDMSGGAAVLSAMWAIARLGVRRNVVGIVPSSENLLSGQAVKPGDVITTRSGRTVEVINTDAEGRLILCDALDWALTLEPEAIVDCATLTGAVVVALGAQAMAVLGTDEALVDEVRAAGDRSGERAWPLPLWPEYRKQLDSETADLKNVGGRPAGTITAACFLREFVREVPWAHLDIAGTAYGDGNGLPYRRKGAYGVPTRLLVEWVRSRPA